MPHRCIVIAFGVALLFAVAPLGGSLYISNGGAAYRINVYGNGANGNAAVERKIEGGTTLLNLPSQIVADVRHGELYVANNFSNSIDVYPLAGAGSQSPLRRLTGAATLLDEPGGVAVDHAHDELVVVNFDDGEDGSVTVYPRAASGNQAPLRRIKGAATGLAWAVEVALDPVAGEIFVSTQGTDGVPAGVRVFARTANGNVAPLRTIAGNATKISTPYGILLDRPHGEVLVTDRDGAISVFARTANGNVAPLRRIAGAATTLLETQGIALLGDSEIVVANDGAAGHDYSDDAVLVFPRTANGNVAPSRRINGPATDLSGPIGVAAAHPSLGLGGGRFGVQAVFRTDQGVIGDGIPVVLTSDTGYLWFFQAPNVEVVVKVLDGCGINQRYWVFAAGLTDTNVDLIVTDYATGAVKVYSNPQKTAFQPIQDTDAFATCGATPSPVLHRPSLDDRSVDGDALRLNGERFEVRAEWETSQGASGVGHPVAITGDTGYFWFFQASNVEVVVKVLDGCGLNQRYWVFAGGLTDVRVRLTVEDKVKGTSIKTYLNPQKTPFQPIQDTAAFATCP